MNTVKRMLLCIVFCYANYFAQAQITNHLFSFHSDSIFDDTLWRCDTTKFVREAGKLRSNSSAIHDTFRVSVPIQKRSSAEWSIELDLGISTSSANYVDVYFWSTSGCLYDSQNAYFVRIGDTKDALVFYEISSGQSRILASSISGIIHSLLGRLVLTVNDDSLGAIAFYDDKETQVFLADSLHLKWNNAQGYMSISVRQSTQSFHNKHYFDNLYYGPPRKDSLTPELQLIEVMEDSILQLHINEPVLDENVETTNFKLVSGNRHPSQITVENDTMKLFFSEKFETGSYVLHVANLSDSSGNVAKDLKIPFNHVLFDSVGRHDVVISEIYADYSPSVGLPENEYLELTNNSNKTFDLLDWELTDGNRTNSLSSYVLWPDSTVILCDAKFSNAFSRQDNVLGISNFIGLNNTGDSLWLTGPSKVPIHEVFYSSSWHQPVWKQEGGWSLEMIDVTRPCKQSENWTSSVHRNGGTPGQMNSVEARLEDWKSPEVIHVEAQKNGLVVTFNESIHSSDVVINQAFLENLSDTLSTEVENNRLQVTFKEKLDTGVLYTIGLRGIQDCFGNEAEEIIVPFGIGKSPTFGDVLLTEVMYDVSEHCVEYVELYNVSERLLDFKELSLAVKDSSGHWKRLYPIKTVSQIFQKDTYKVVCTDSLRLKDCKANAMNIVQSDKLPMLVNETGNIGVTNRYGDVLDSFTYADAMHFPLLSDTKDVSLERLQPQLSERTWLSSSQHHNFGTTGFENSHIVKGTPRLNTLTIQTDPVSPNFDGYNDQLIVAVTVSKENVAHLRIYDLAGRLIAFPVNTNLIAGTSHFVWDCLDANGGIVQPGIYVADFEAIALDGIKMRERSVFTVTW